MVLRGWCIVRNRRSEVRRGKKILFGIFLIVCGLAALFILFDSSFRPLIKNVAGQKAASVCGVIVNDAVLETLEESGLGYDSLVNIERMSDGSVTSINSNMVNLNRFKAMVANNVQQKINDYEKQKVSIPIGTVIGGDLFVGRGPSVTFTLDMSCSVRCSVTNQFDDAGINQTRHRITLSTVTDVYIVIPWYNTGETIENDFVIAETVIVGDVPEYYTSVTGSEDVAGDINDYGAEPDD